MKPQEQSPWTGPRSSRAHLRAIAGTKGQAECACGGLSPAGIVWVAAEADGRAHCPNRLACLGQSLFRHGIIHFSAGGSPKQGRVLWLAQFSQS